MSQNFNVRQLNAINSTDTNILCLAAAASGKTAVVTSRIKRLLDEGVPPSSIVSFTFTNQAAQEMRDRLGEKSKEMFIGTIHSYANKICGYGGVSTMQDINLARFDEILKKAIFVPIKFYPPVEHLFVDEFQDTDELQFKFINKIPAKNRFYVGDERQNIYTFRGTTDKFIREAAMDSTFKKYYLTQNYRNPYNIIDFAEGLLASMQKISESPEPTILEEGYLGKRCKFDDAVEEMTWTSDWGNWTILCRKNEELIVAQEYLDKLNIPNVIIKRGDLDLEQMYSLLSENRVKLMTIHSAKGLEFPNVIAVGAKTFSEDERRIAYVAATRAMKSLYWCSSIAPKRKKGANSSYTNAGNIFAKQKNKMVSF